MPADGFVHQLPDADPDETREWIESLDAVVDRAGTARARYLLTRLLDHATARDVGLSAAISTPYVNTIPAEQEPWFPGDEDLERRIRAFVRWNAVAMVDRANHRFDGLGGHLSTYASAAALYEVGFNHFFHGKDDGAHGDQVFIQGHAAPGIYARAFLEGRLTEEQVESFRREVDGNGLPSYPHPRRLPDFWEFPTVSMGLSPLNAVAQARINRYLLHHELADTSQAKVWCFVGDGEMDEPEAKAGLSIAAREQLDNLIFVVNCNLQRLDGPVRGGGKIIQELEMAFRGAGWNVIKVIWGRGWDALLAADVDGVLVRKMNETVDGDFQKYATESGAYIREHFFGPDPRLRKMVEHLSDEDLQKLPRGGHDYRKLYAAYRVATEHRGSPTVILAKTVKGWTLGSSVEARNATHQVKKMTPAEWATFRDRLYMDIPDDALGELAPYAAAGRGLARGRLPARPSQRAQRCAAATGERRAADRARPRHGLGGVPRRDRTEAHRVDDDGVRPTDPQAPREPRRGAARGAHHPGRGAHLRARRAVLRREDLLTVRPDVGAGRRRAPAVVPRGAHRTGAGGGDQRGRLDGVVHGRGHGVRDVGSTARAVLHLLFDVRVPAGRRPDLVVRRPARARVPARRDRGPHDADGGGAAALRRTEPAARERGADVPQLRPGVRLRGRGDHRGRPRPHVRA